MMRGSHRRRLTIVAAAAAALATGESLRAYAECTADVECKGTRICDQGRCAYPPPQNTVAPSVSPSAATPPSPCPPPAAASAAPPVAAVPDRKMQIGVAFLSTFLGQASIGASPSGIPDDGTPSLGATHGIALSLDYTVVAGLSLGVAPQFFWGLNTNDNRYKSDTQLDLMARIAYAYKVIPKLAVYAEVTPGYSIMSYEVFITEDRVGMLSSDRARGFVIGLGGGAAYDLTDTFFANLGIGYQLGFQNVPNVSFAGATNHARTRFLRIAIGGGLKF